MARTTHLMREASERPPGGQIVTQPPPIRWAPATAPDSLPDGTIGDVGFFADLTPTGTWTINLAAC